MTEQHIPELEPGTPAAFAVAIAAHPFTDGLDPDHIHALAELAGEVELDGGEYVFRHGRPADTLYLLTRGDVALEIPNPGDGTVVLQTLHEGDVLGWSWLHAPYTWHLDAHAVTDVTAIAIDGVALRGAMAEDAVMGCVVSMRIGRALVDRLHHARDQLAAAHAR